MEYSDQNPRHHKKMDNGITINSDYYQKIMNEELSKIKDMYGEENYNNRYFHKASDMFFEMISGKNLDEFLTLPAYKHI